MLTAEMTSEVTSQPTTPSREHERISLGQPDTSLRLRRFILYLVFACCVSLYLLPFMRLLLQYTNEGTFVDGAVRTAHGQLLGRDFFEVMGPGTFYWLALFFKFFGVTFLASRLCLFVTSLGTALSIYFLSRRLCRSYQVLPCVVVFATYYGALWPALNHHVISNCFSLLAVSCMVLWREFHMRWLLAAAGALAGVTVLTLQPKGILLLLSFLVWLVMEHRLRSAPLAALAWVTGGCFTVITVMLGYFWTRGALGDLIYANVAWPAHNYGTVNSVQYAFALGTYFNRWIAPTQGFHWTMAMAAVMVIPFFFIAALPALVVFLGVRHRVHSIRGDVALYWLAGSALWISELHRKDMAHLVVGSPLLIILCIYYLQASHGKTSSLALQALSIVSVWLAGCTLLSALLAHPTMTRAGQVSLSKPDPVLAVLDKNVPPGGDLFIYPYSPMYYFLSNTNNPTRYSFLVYSYYTPAQFEETIRTLDQHRVKYVLWDKHVQHDILDVFFPNAHPKQLIMEPYLESHYRPIWVHDNVLFMERNDDDHLSKAVGKWNAISAPIHRINKGPEATH